MSREKLREAPPQRACPVSMNNPHAWLSRKSGFIEKVVHAPGGFLHRASDHIDFTRRWLGARLHTNSDPETSGSHGIRRRLALDPNNIRERHFHPQSPCFHLGHAAIMPSKKHRPLE